MDFSGLVLLGAGDVSGLPRAALELLVGAGVLGEIIIKKITGVGACFVCHG